MGEFGISSRLDAPWRAALSSAGAVVTASSAMGLPAVSNVIRSPAEMVAALPFIVYRAGEIRERAEASWQWRLLHDEPSPECDPFEFFYDLELSLEATQNAFVQKAKYDGRVYALYVLDPQRVTVRRDRDTGEKVFDVFVSPSDVRRDLTSSEILHVRGFTPEPGGITGVSLLQMHRDPIGAAIAMQGFEGDYFRNSARSPFFFELGDTGNADSAKQMVDSYHEQHQGIGNQFKVGAVWGGTKVVPLPLSMDDAQFADAKRLSIEDACRIWKWPKQLVEVSDGQQQTDENAWTSRFLKFYFLPRLRRIERAFVADHDLFPRTGRGTGYGYGSSLFGEFLTQALERADFVTRVRGYKDARQGSWITANEIRRMENLPPVAGGDEILITPVGAAPNPVNAPGEPAEAA